MKTRHILEREHDRVEKVKKARESSVQIAMETSAKLILKERRYDSNMKRHQKMQKEDEIFRNDKFDQLIEQRREKRNTTIEEDIHLNQLGYERFKKDRKDVEGWIEKARKTELQQAKDSFLRLRGSMELTDKKQNEAEENFNRSAVEAKKTLENIWREAKQKEESATRTINKIKEKCQNQFETQKQNFRNYEELSESRLYNQSAKVYNKFTSTNMKSRDLKERTMNTVEDHKQRNEERFGVCNEGLQRAADQRSQFLKREEKRHKTKVEARDNILLNMSVDHEQRREMRKLHLVDTSVNIDRERKKKQEFQDFLLKKEFMKNAFNQEANNAAAQMVNQSKLLTNSMEVEAVHQSRLTQVLKMKKPDQILAEVRNKKIAELNQYKEANTEKKYTDIQKLLTMMNAHGKLPNSSGKKQANDTQSKI